MLNANIEAALIQTSNKNYHCIVQLNQEWFSFDNLNNQKIIPIWPRDFKYGSLRVLFPQDLNHKNNIDINLEWIKEFNKPSKIEN